MQGGNATSSRLKKHDNQVQKLEEWANIGVRPDSDDYCKR